MQIDHIFRIIFATGLIVFSAGNLAASNIRIAQSSKNYDEKLISNHILDFALQAPNYSDETSIGQHIAFSLILAQLTNNAAADSRDCNRFLIEPRFPNLAVNQLEPATARSVRRCLESLSSFITTELMTRTAFDRAVENAMRFRQISVDAASFTEQKLSLGMRTIRLVLLGELALKQLFPRNAVIKSQLAYYEWLLKQRTNYDGYIKWLSGQRISNRMGFHSSSGLTIDQLREWKIGISNLSVEPILQVPEIEYSQGISVGVPRLRGRSFIVVHCDSNRDRQCTERIGQYFCGKTIDEVISAKPSKRPQSTSSLMCGHIGWHFPLSGWLTVDSDDTTAVNSLYDQLVSRRLFKSDVDASIVEYVVFVNVN